MAEVIWTERARKSVVEIGHYIEEDSLRYAEIVITKLYAAAERLKTFPLSGRVVPEVGSPNLREVIQGNYRIIYKYSREHCVILHVVHARKDLTRQLAE